MFVDTFTKRIKAALYQKSDPWVTEQLYRLSKRSLLILIALVCLSAWLFYPTIQEGAVVWAAALIGVITFRLWLLKRFIRSDKSVSGGFWHMKFFFSALATATLFSSLGVLYLSDMDPYHQILFLTILLGLASGSITSLSPDSKLAIAYLAVLIFPNMIALVFLENSQRHILVFAMMLYFVSLLTMIRQNETMRKAYAKIQSKHHFFNNLFKEAPIGIFSYDKNLNILNCNKALTELFEYRKEDLIGLSLFDLSDTRILPAFHKSLKEGSQRYEGPYVSLNGKEYWIEVNAFTFREAHYDNAVGIGIVEDKTKEHAATEKLKYMVNHDILTGLLNRRGFRSYMRDFVNHPNHRSFYSLLYYIDLDRFKEINDTMGHSMGDKVLLAVSKRLQNKLPGGSIVARLGGDEFITVLPYISTEKSALESISIEIVAELEKIFGDPVSIDGTILYLRASIGIVIIEPETSDIEEIIRHADITMYQAKKSQTGYAFYDRSIDQTHQEKFLLQNELSNVFKNNELCLYFQPIIDIKQDNIYAVEALLRWKHPVRGLISPEAFIPMAIKTGMLNKITWWVIEEVCKTLRRIRSDGYVGLDYISININALDLLQKDFYDRFVSMLEKYGVSPKEIVFEITERSLIDNFVETQTIIDNLRKGGVRCAIDDFGVGYSSLSYLKKLSFDILKIDKAFVRHIEHQEPKEIVLMHSILTIGRQYGYDIVVEGLESNEQKEIIQTLDKNVRVQGFLYYRPMTFEDFAKILRKKSA